MRASNFFSIKKTSLYDSRHNDDFGTLGLSLVHDLSSTITALLLDIERLKNDSQAIEQAIQTARAQITGQENNLVQIGSEIRRCMRDFSARCEEKGIQLSAIITQDHTIAGNPDKLQIVLNNLVRNAIDAVSGSNDPWVQLRLTATNAHIIVEITDNGQGVPESRKQQLFSIGQSTKSKSNHLGVGLVLVKRIVERDFNGNVRVISNPQGSSFQLVLPR